MLNAALESYHKDLKPYEWIFTYEDGTKKIIRFNDTDLMHLWGIQYHPLYAMKKISGARGLSSKFYRELSAGTFTKENIEKDSGKRNYIERIVTFPHLKAILDDPDTEHYQYDETKSKSKIKANTMLYHPKTNLHCHFFHMDTGQGEEGIECCSVSWFPVTPGNANKHTAGQTRLNLKTTEKRERNKPTKQTIPEIIRQTIDSLPEPFIIQEQTIDTQEEAS